MTGITAPQFHPLVRARLHLLEGVPSPGATPETPETQDRRRSFDAPFGEPELPLINTEERLVVPG